MAQPVWVNTLHERNNTDDSQSVYIIKPILGNRFVDQFIEL